MVWLSGTVDPFSRALSYIEDIEEQIGLSIGQIPEGLPMGMGNGAANLESSVPVLQIDT